MRKGRLQFESAILVAFLLFPPTVSDAFAEGVYAKSRDVLITWDKTASDENTLTILVTPEGESTQDPITGADAYTFVLNHSDRVAFSLKWKGNETGDISYVVTGTDFDAKELEALKNLFSGNLPTSQSDQGTGQLGAATNSIMKAVAEDLISGGRLTVTFSLKQRQGSGNNEQLITTYTSGEVSFRVKSRPPRLTISNGIAITTAPEPSLAIIKTSEVITFEKDGKEQQAFRQAISLKDDAAVLQPIQTAVTFANFRLTWKMFISLGIQLNQKIFEEPILGLTYRQPVFGTMGLNLLVGAHFSNEDEIDDESGFSDGMKLDPTLGLTVDDIPIDPRYRLRFVFGFSVDF